MHIIKRKGHAELYKQKKAHHSIYKAGLNASLTRQEATTLATAITKQLNTWIHKKKTITAHQLFVKITELLNKKEKNTALMYETHRDLS